MSSAKTASSTGSKSYNFFGTIAAGFCVGPLYRLDGIDIDGERVWSGSLLRSESTNPVSIGIPGRGIIRFYWGTEDQLTPDPALTAGGNGLYHDHPAYTGDCYAVLVNFLFGQERTTAPDVRFVGVREPVQSLISGSATLLVDDHANPFVVIAELLTSERCGLGKPVSLFAAAAWQAAADALIPRASTTYVSVWIDRQQNARAVGLDLMRLCDGWMRAETATGKAEVGLYPPPEDIVLSSLPLINSASLAGPGKPHFEPQTMDDVISRTDVTFTDRTQNYKKRSVGYIDPVAGSRNTQTVDARHYLVRPAQADDFAVRLGRRDALPKVISDGLSVRAAHAAALRPGQHIRTDIDAEPGGVQLEQVFRITSITRTPVGPARVQIESEPTLAPVLYDPGDEPTPPALIEVADIANARFFELPPPLADGGEFAVGVLASRPGDLVTECAVLYDPVSDSGSTFPPLGSHRNYALRARLTADYSNIANTPLAIELLDSVGQEIIAENPGPTAARNNELLLLVFGAVDTSGGGYRLPLEVFSVVESVSTGTNLLAVSILRARAGTPRAAHYTDDEVWIIRRAYLPWYRHRDFAGQAAAATLCYFKLQPGTFQASRPLEDCAPRSFQFDTSRAYAPAITLTSPVNDVGEDYVSCTIGDNVTFAGSIADSDGNLTGFAISRTSLTGETQLVTRTLAGVSALAFSESVLFDTGGVYTITLTASDSTGRFTNREIEIRCSTSSTGAVQAPIRELTYDDRRVFEPDPDEGYHGEIVGVSILRCPTMAAFGGPSYTIRMRWIRVGVGGACPDLDSFELGSVNAETYVDTVEDDHEWTHEERRTWAYAEDTTGTLTRSPARYFE